MMRRFTIASLAAGLVLSTVALPAAAQDPAPVEVTLLHDTHLHGKYSQSVDGTTIGIAEYFALVAERKADLGDNALFLANGDDIGPSVHSGLFEPHGIHMVDALNEAPVDVNTFGNHEFDYGPENLRGIIAAADYPYVTANVRDVDTGDVFGADLGVEEFLTFDIDGVTVGVTGLAPEGMDSITTLGEDTEQIPAEEALDIVVPKMNDAGVDVIVVDSHLCGSDAKALADTYAGIDIIAGDHCGVYEPELYQGDAGAVVSLVADEYQYLGELTLTVVAGELVTVERTVYEMKDEVGDLTGIQAVQDVVDDYDARLDEELNVVIGERAVDWDTRTTVVRTGESAAGNYFTDEMRTAFGGSDIAVTNSGGIRGNQVYPAGDITRREIAEIFPFGNRLVQAEIEGGTLLEALEHSVSASREDDGTLAPNGGFLQVSGMRFSFDSTLPAGERVRSVTIGGQPLDPDRTYTMATNDFTLGGGDGYTMFRDDTNVLVDSNGGPVLDSFLMERIEARDGTITTDVEGRIVDETFLYCPETDGSGFPDVPEQNVHSDNIACAAELELFLGKRNGDYEPQESLTRGQAASVIDRIADATGRSIDGERRTFSDVTGGPHQDAIERLAGAGVINGFEDGTFGPTEEVTRAQLGALVVRLIEETTGRSLPQGERFSDVGAGSTHDMALRKARGAGIMLGTSDGRALPNRDIQRDQAASLFVRSLGSLPMAD